ncbi:MAG: protein translocase subunit SecD [Verrucomicrobiales bacterium]
MLALTSLFADPLTVFTVGLVLMILFFWYFATELESRKRNVGTVLTVGIVGLCIVAATPPSKKLKGSIDIVGGSSFSLRVQEKENDEGDKIPVTPQQVEQAILVIEKRLNSMGTTEPLIAGQGDNGILVQMPGVSEEESAQVRTTLEKVAKLELREVSLRTDEIGPDGRTLAARVQSGDEIVPGYRAYNHTRKDEDGNEMTSPILLNRRMALGGSDIAMAVPSPQQADAVAITLNGDGTDKMINLTKDMTPRQGRIAIVLDGEVISAPVVNQVPLGKNFIIEGLTEPGEVQSLANSLMNPLENPLVVDEERTVSPLLGKAVIEQGVWAGLVGLSLTFVFVLLYYRSAGIIALLGLLVNGTILFGVMAMFGFAFSLPGIAGMVLIIGMSVDANVLIYERLREEIEHGKSLKNAINSAYEKAFSAIFDSNVTSLITAIILFSLGSGSIKGFAITLTVGLLASMFSAILVTRVLFRWMLDTGLLKKLSFLNLIKSANYDFLAKRRICAFVSLALLVVAFGAFGAKREKAFGIDFTGGSLIEFQLGDVVVPLEDVQNTLNGLKLTKEAYPQEQSNPASGTLLTVRCDAKDTEQITNALREQIPALGKTAEGSDTNYLIDVSKQEVSALIGSSFLSQSLIALIVGMIAILLYVTVRFEFAFAVGAFVAILHDVIISIGIVILLGGELSLIHVGAILTIAGYSVNDTIVVFDRIRETLLVRSGSIMKIMNESINATLSRTILTSATTIATVAILSVFGGSALRDFSVTILIGLIVGTYSSIFVATPIVLWWSSRKGGDIRADVRATEIAAEAAANAP